MNRIDLLDLANWPENALKELQGSVDLELSLRQQARTHRVNAARLRHLQRGHQEDLEKALAQWELGL